MSKIEDEFELYLKSINVKYEREYRFSALYVGLGAGIRDRLKEAGLKDWRFDFAIPIFKIAVEIEGGTWAGGRHTRGAGYEEDCRKYNAAISLGWNVFRFTTGMVESGEAYGVIDDAISAAIPF